MKTSKTDIKKMLGRESGSHHDKVKFVAKKLGKTPRYIYMLEGGTRVPSDTLRKLIKVYLAK